MKIMKAALVAAMALSFFTGCQSAATGPIRIVWYPNESGEELLTAREEIGKIITAATGREVTHQLTTDYAIAIESIVNDNADFAWQGAQGYVESHAKNEKILPLVVNSGESGTLNDALYYSWLSVRLGDEGMYKTGEEYSILNIKGKPFSFVSTSSTSGGKVPSAGIVNFFKKLPETAAITQEELWESGPFFSKVLFGSSHQGSAVNLLSGVADVAAFCDACVANYVEFVSGTENRPGAIYKVKDGADEPFDKYEGQQFVIISVTPVLNAPFVYNSATIPADQVKALVEAFSSDEVANNPAVFTPAGGSVKGLFKKKANERFLAVEDSWFQPIRDLSN